MPMKKILPLYLLCGICATACVDESYDLNKIDTGNIAIGDESSRFEIPLVKVLVGMDNLNSDDQTPIDELFNEADTWLPTQLPDQDENGPFIYVQRLTDDPEFVNNTLLSALIAEMETDDAKLDDVATLLSERYYDSFASLLPGVTPENFKETFKEEFRNNEMLHEQLVGQVELLASNYLSTLEVNLSGLSYDIEHIDISDEIIDMLTDNLDPEGTPDSKNTLHIAGTIDNKLPLSLTATPVFTPTDVSFTTAIKANSYGNELPETQLFAEDLRTIVRGITIDISVVLDKYYPGKGFERETDAEEQTQLQINLHLIKRGGLKFDL